MAFYTRFHSTQDQPRSGRPRVTTPAQDRYIRLHHLRHRQATATDTAGKVPGLRRISDQTVRNRLREAGIRARRPVIGSALRRQHRLQRVRWCNNVQARNMRNWNRVWLRDESRYLLQRRDGRQRVYRRQNERFMSNCIRQVDRFGGGSVMVLGGHILQP